MTEIDKTKPVRLKQLAAIGGNIYHEGDYQPGALPDSLLNDAYVTQDAPPLPGSPITASTVQVEQIEISTTSETVTPKGYPTPTPVLNTSIVSKVNINTADNDTLASLPNVGPPTAVKILEAREKGLFKDLQDLSDRVSLTRGKWEDIQTRLLF